MWKKKKKSVDEGGQEEPVSPTSPEETAEPPAEAKVEEKNEETKKMEEETKEVDHHRQQQEQETKQQEKPLEQEEKEPDQEGEKQKKAKKPSKPVEEEVVNESVDKAKTEEVVKKSPKKQVDKPKPVVKEETKKSDPENAKPEKSEKAKQESPKKPKKKAPGPYDNIQAKVDCHNRDIRTASPRKPQAAEMEPVVASARRNSKVTPESRLPGGEYDFLDCLPAADAFLWEQEEPDVMELRGRMHSVQQRCEETVGQFTNDVQNLSIELSETKKALEMEREARRDLEQVRIQYERDINGLSTELRSMTMEMREAARRQKAVEEQEQLLAMVLGELGINQVSEIRLAFRSLREKNHKLETILRNQQQQIEWSNQAAQHLQQQCQTLETEIESARKARWQADMRRMKVEEEHDQRVLELRKSRMQTEQLAAQVSHLTLQLKSASTQMDILGRAAVRMDTMPSPRNMHFQDNQTQRPPSMQQQQLSSSFLRQAAPPMLNMHDSLFGDTSNMYGKPKSPRSGGNSPTNKHATSKRRSPSPKPNKPKAPSPSPSPLKRSPLKKRRPAEQSRPRNFGNQSIEIRIPKLKRR